MTEESVISSKKLIFNVINYYRPGFTMNPSLFLISPDNILLKKSSAMCLHPAKSKTYNSKQYASAFANSGIFISS
jgi:hypothetical protein